MDMEGFLRLRLLLLAYFPEFKVPIVNLPVLYPVYDRFFPPHMYFLVFPSAWVSVQEKSHVTAYKWFWTDERRWKGVPLAACHH